MKKPYRKKLAHIAPFVVWEVDGAWVREKQNMEFTNFGQHYKFRFIPKYEFWLDRESAPGERQFFVDHLLVEWRQMHQGKSYATAIVAADRKELVERKKASLPFLRLQGKYRKPIPPSVYVRKLTPYSQGVAVWVVNGELVRDMFFIDFTEGGHHFVYPWVPKGEVWIDNDLPVAERRFVILHELHERYLMAKGWVYDSAHRSALLLELKARKHTRLFHSYVQLELKRNILLQ